MQGCYRALVPVTFRFVTLQEREVEDSKDNLMRENPSLENMFSLENVDLGEDEEDRDGPAPGVHGLKVTGGDGVQVPGREEADHQAGEGDQREEDVEESGAAGEAAAGAGVHQHPLADTVDRAQHHQQRVEAPLQSEVSSHPVEREGSGPLPPVLHQPVEQDRQHAVEQELGQQADQVQPASSSSGAGRL